MDAKEIYQAVLEECTAYIKKIKKEYGEELARCYTYKIDNLEKQNKQMAERIDKLESLVKNQSVQLIPKNAVSNDTDRIIIDHEILMSAFEYDGWLYYANEKMGHFLFKVRKDGTGNEQLTNYSVNDMGTFGNIKNGKLYFKNKDYRECSIPI